jgi:hypothetical protein
VVRDRAGRLPLVPAVPSLLPPVPVLSESLRAHAHWEMEAIVKIGISAITVQELIDSLVQVEDKSRVVVLARDPEGNGFALADANFNDDWRYDPVRSECADDDERGVPCIVLWPTS